MPALPTPRRCGSRCIKPNSKGRLGQTKRASDDRLRETEIGTRFDCGSLSEMHRVRELNEAIASYEKVLATYTRTREHLIARRHGAADHVMVELDERLETNATTIDALHRA